MSYQLEFAFCPANELINSFFTYTCKTALRRSDREKAWSKQVEERLSKDFMDRLQEDEFVPKMSKLGFIHFFVQACPNQHDASTFITWLGSLSGGDMYELLSPFMNQFQYDLAMVRDKFVYYLQGWYEYYFQYTDQGILQRLGEEAENRKNQLTKVDDITVLIEEATNGLFFEPVDHLKKIILIPQFYASPVNWVYPFEEVTICHYSFDALTAHDPEEPSAILKEGAKAISDVNRLKILRFLSHESKTFIEVVRHLGIAKSTAYEHTIVLRSAGLIRSHIVGDTAIAYSLRREGFTKLKEELTEWIR